MKEMLALIGLSGGEATLIFAAFVIAGMLLIGLLQLPANINKKLLAWIAAGVAVAIPACWSIARLALVDGAENPVSSAAEYALFILTLPAQLYIGISGGRHLSPPSVVTLILADGLIWGLVIERVFARSVTKASLK